MSLDEKISKATAETNTSENWGLIIEICEKADSSESAAREAIQILSKRIAHRNVNVALYSLTVANALVQNCGITVHREVSSRLFLDSLVKQVANTAVHSAIKTRILELIQQWAENFKSDSSLGYTVDTYNQLKAQGYQFPNPNKKPEVVHRQSDIDREKEEEELQLAMALSLSAQENAKKQSSSSTPSKAPPKAKEICKVRALYDFAGLEEGELRMNRGDIVNVYDDTTFKDWWKGELRGAVGIFPANYVERLPDGFDPASESRSSAAPSNPSATDPEKVDEFVQLLSRIDPKRDNLSENDRIQELYQALLMMRPKVIKEIETKHAAQEELRVLNERFTTACSTYHKLMEASLAAQRNAYTAGGYNQYQQPPAQYPAPAAYQPYPQSQQPLPPPTHMPPTQAPQPYPNMYYPSQ
ncbi:ESCRT-0 subunit protein hse1 [Phlyctochytrium bullatum]|nr:ESCRT-0 subunit protein hse1 [Phlyctochytrium bullatum]